MVYLFSLRKVVAIIVGSILIAIGIDFFLMPIKVLDGGFIGIALIMNYLFRTTVGLTLILFSIPVFIYTWFKDRDIFFPSLYGLIFLSYFIDLLDPYYPLGSFNTDYPFVTSLCGGCLIGIGFGILLKHDTSTGGMDLLAMLLTKGTPLNVGILILIMDAIVVTIGGVLFSADTFYLSIASITAGGLATSLYTSKFFNS